MKQNKNSGFTIVELLIVISILAVVCSLIGYAITSCSSNKSSAESEARKYAQSLGLEIKGTICMTKDSDGDGYVSCSISYLDNGKTSIMPIECANRWSVNDGCRATKVINNGNRSW